MNEITRNDCSGSTARWTESCTRKGSASFFGFGARLCGRCWKSTFRSPSITYSRAADDGSAAIYILEMELASGLVYSFHVNTFRRPLVTDRMKILLRVRYYSVENMENLETWWCFFYTRRESRPIFIRIVKHSMSWEEKKTSMTEISKEISPTPSITSSRVKKSGRNTERHVGGYVGI